MTGLSIRKIAATMGRAPSHRHPDSPNGVHEGASCRTHLISQAPHSPQTSCAHASPGGARTSTPQTAPPSPANNRGSPPARTGICPPQQPGGEHRERSVEHLHITPVFGTAQPLHGPAGAIRRYAYRTYSEGQTAHWLLLIAADRVEAMIAHITSFASPQPDNLITESGVLGERGRHPIRSRFRRGRIDLKHAWADPLLVVGPWVLALLVWVTAAKRLTRVLRKQ